MQSHSKRLIRIYSPFNPYPPVEGSPRVIVSQIEGIQAGGSETELVTWKDRHQLEGPWQKAARVAKSLVTQFASPELYYYPPSTMPELRGVHAELGIYNYSFAYTWLKARGARTREAKVAVHFHNLESELFEQRARYSRGLAKKMHELNASRLRDHERELASLSDEQWFVSQVDLELYRSRVPEARCRWVGPGFSPEEGGVRRREFLKSFDAGKAEKHPILALLGRYDFGPNRESLEWVVDRLAPCLEKQGFKGRLQILGSGVSDGIKRRAARFEFFEFLGFVESIEPLWPLWSHALVPHVSGSGVRIKLLEAIASGLPVITNPEAVAPIGKDLADLTHLHSLSRPEEWSQRIISSRPGEERAKLSRAPYPDSLDPRRIYGFIEELCGGRH